MSISPQFFNCHLSLLCPYVALEHNHLIGLGEGTTYLEGEDTLHPCASRAPHVFRTVRSHLQVLVASILFAEDSCILPSDAALDGCLENSHQTSLGEGRTCLGAAYTPPFGDTQAYGLAEKNNHHLDLEEDNSCWGASSIPLWYALVNCSHLQGTEASKTCVGVSCIHLRCVSRVWGQSSHLKVLGGGKPY